MFEIGEAARQPGERRERAPKQQIERSDDRYTDRKRDPSKCNCVLPNLCNLVAWLADDNDGTDLPAVGGHGDDVTLDRRGDERLKPGRRGSALALRGSVIAGDGREVRHRGIGGIPHRYADMPQKPQLQRQPREHLLRRRVVADKLQGLGDEKLREPGGGLDLNAGRRACFENCHRTGHERGGNLDCQHDDEQLTSNRVAMPV